MGFILCAGPPGGRPPGGGGPPPNSLSKENTPGLPPGIGRLSVLERRKYTASKFCQSLTRSAGTWAIWVCSAQAVHHSRPCLATTSVLLGSAISGASERSSRRPSSLIAGLPPSQKTKADGPIMQSTPRVASPARSRRCLQWIRAKAAAMTAGAIAMRKNRGALSPCTHGPVITRTPTAHAPATEKSAMGSSARRRQQVRRAAMDATAKTREGPTCSRMKRTGAWLPGNPGIPPGGPPPGPPGPILLPVR